MVSTRSQHKLDKARNRKKHQQKSSSDTTSEDDENISNTSGEEETEKLEEFEDPNSGLDTVTAIMLIFVIFTVAFIGLSFVYMKFPKMSAEDERKVKLPKSIDDAKALGKVLSRYTDNYFFEVLVAFTLTYIFLQSFAIPGSIFLSILSGYLFPFPLALFLVCFCSSSGASFCYLISSIIGQKVVNRFFLERVRKWKTQVQRHEKDLLSYITFLRITPFLPNWFINITSPVLNVPLTPFFVGTFLGVAPPSFGFISAGVELYELTTTGDAFSFKSVLIVIGSAIISLLPVMFRRQLQKKIE
ncbi:transmembrane protein 41B-like [Clytia hemisphaerica]|uniref:VTT domain-containing protein n=1 Tax=Clytia hemisphaerica TaxID=252671 RepID=A0A7M6DPF6_9CNID